MFVERLWRTIKYERVYLRAYAGVSVARADLAEFIDWYNTERPHSSLYDQTPDEIYWARLQDLFRQPGPLLISPSLMRFEN